MAENVPAPSQSWRRGFWGLIATQFQGAFNDNGLKFFVIFVILGQNPTTSQKDFGVFMRVGLSPISTPGVDQVLAWPLHRRRSIRQRWRAYQMTIPNAPR